MSIGRRWSWLVAVLALAVGEPVDASPVRIASDGLSAIVDAAGARLALGRHALGMSVRAIGRPDAMVGVAAGPVTMRGAEAWRDLGPGIEEWWRAAPGGLEHGVTLTERPVGEAPLVLEIAVGGLVPTQHDGDGLVLRDGDGRAVARYEDLVALDTTGAWMPARMTADGGGIRIEVDDRAARYPLVVDPLVALEEAMLISSAPGPSDRLGEAVALSSDATYAIVGQPSALAAGWPLGNARIFTRSASIWTEAGVLAPSGAPREARFGSALAMSAAGDRVLVGALRDTRLAPAAGAAYVFARIGTTWTEEAFLAHPTPASSDEFGSAVALSDDGLVAVVGDRDDDTAAGTNAGSVHVFRRSGSTWSPEAVLLAPDAATLDGFGSAVAIARDGSRILVGAVGDDRAASNSGSVHVFRRDPTGWTAEALLDDPAGGSGDAFGRGLAVDATGSRAVILVDDGGSREGSARVHVRSGTVWTEEARFQPGLPSHEYDSAALSGDGSLVLVGGRSFSSATRIFARTGTIWTEATTPFDPADAEGAVGHAVAIARDGSRALVSVPTDDVTGRGTYDGSARVLTLRTTLADGVACTLGAECTSGFCVDGVCCATACGGGSTTDCEACSSALTGATSGTCALLSAAVAPTVICRAASDACDLAETCTAASATCPADALASGTTCRAAASACDTPESCTGAGPACPSDLPSPSGTTCRASTGACDAAEVCNGTSFACPGDGFAPSAVVCRSTADACDVEETCTGTSPVCPLDAFGAPGTSCRPALGACDIEEACTGLSAACPPDLFAPSSTPCGDASTDVCDADDHCAGTSADCVDAFLAGTTCRPSAGPCDVAEICPGDLAACPSDAVAAVGLVCRASTAPGCDPEEACDGASTSCPADERDCSDAGSPDAGGTDAATASDAGAPVATTGCGCRTAPRPGPAACGALVALACDVVRRARRRAASVERTG